jgi:outer membrane lipoprotein carrier protein
MLLRSYLKNAVVAVATPLLATPKLYASPARTGGGWDVKSSWPRRSRRRTAPWLQHLSIDWIPPKISRTFGLTLSCALLLLSTLPVLAQQISPAGVKDLLARVANNRATAPQVEADFQEEKIVHLMNKPIISAGRIWFEAPNKFRREVKGASPSITVSDGKQLWIYYPNFKSAEHYSLGKHSPVDAALTAVNTALNLENAEKSFQITGSKTSNGYELMLLPRAPSMKRMFQRFDLRMNSDLLVTRTEMLQPNGDRVITTYSNQSRAPIPASTFAFIPPRGTEITTPLGR